MDVDKDDLDCCRHFTYPNIRPIVVMKFFQINVSFPSGSYLAHSEIREPIEYRSWEVGKRMKRRESIQDKREEQCNDECWIKV